MLVPLTHLRASAALPIVAGAGRMGRVEQAGIARQPVNAIARSVPVKAATIQLLN